LAFARVATISRIHRHPILPVQVHEAAISPEERDHIAAITAAAAADEMGFDASPPPSPLTSVAAPDLSASQTRGVVDAEPPDGDTPIDGCVTSADAPTEGDVCRLCFTSESARWVYMRNCACAFHRHCLNGWRIGGHNMCPRCAVPISAALFYTSFTGKHTARDLDDGCDALNTGSTPTETGPAAGSPPPSKPLQLSSLPRIQQRSPRLFFGVHHGSLIPHPTSNSPGLPEAVRVGMAESTRHRPRLATIKINPKYIQVECPATTTTSGTTPSPHHTLTRAHASQHARAHTHPRSFAHSVSSNQFQNFSCDGGWVR
jgi:hypothetical protein